ncbi:MAG: PPOX class F420-dependent oxidoreductase [Candidatus Odinarchaeota archaeon]
MSEEKVANAFAYLEGKRTISLTTYRKNGTGVSTPVEFVNVNGKLYISTRKDSYKVKRIKNDTNAEIAPCTMRGKETGSRIKVKARILSEEEQQLAIDSLKALYSGIMYRVLGKLFFMRNKDERVYLEVIPAV